MAIEAEGHRGGPVRTARRAPAWVLRLRIATLRLGRVFGHAVFSSLTRRIVVLNLFALAALLGGILYLNQFRSGLIDERIDRLKELGQVIAAAIAASTTTVEDRPVDIDRLLDEPQASESPLADLSIYEFPIDPQRVAPFLRSYISPTRTRARIYDRDGFLLMDSRQLYLLRGGTVGEPPPIPPSSLTDRIADLFERGIAWFTGKADMEVYRELGPGAGSGYREVAEALGGATASIVRVTTKGELIVSVGVPIQRQGRVRGALLLSTQGGDIDGVIRSERLQILRVFLVAAGVTTVLSILLAGTIAGPMRRLAAGADAVRRSVKLRGEIPDFSDREDEIGHLSTALRDMTSALYKRMEATENFAADVAHELKNPLTSLRSAVETLPLAKSETSRARLMEVIQHDVRRLDRLISDISDASRLDAELAREDLEPVDLQKLLETVTGWQGDLAKPRGQKVPLAVVGGAKARGAFVVPGHDSRLGQVFTNLVDNARSFTPDGGTITVKLAREADAVVVTVEDEGPGIRPDVADRIFERFYTDRPDGEGFGNNSGLGLAISKQIVEAHRGTIEAGNRRHADGSVAGARFVVRLPA